MMESFRIGPVPSSKGWTWMKRPAEELNDKLFELLKGKKLVNFNVLRDSGSYPVEQCAWILVDMKGQDEANRLDTEEKKGDPA